MTYLPRALELAGGRIAGTAVDDRAGCAALLALVRFAGLYQADYKVDPALADAAARTSAAAETAPVVEAHVFFFNDVASVVVQARVTPAVRPGQLLMYNGWEPYQFKDWKDLANVEPGMVKWLHFAGGYGHLRYRALHWQPVPVDRHVRVDVALAED